MEQDYSNCGTQLFNEDSLLMAVIVGQESDLYLIDNLLHGAYSLPFLGSNDYLPH